jgi:hypothetical protein
VGPDPCGGAASTWFRFLSCVTDEFPVVAAAVSAYPRCFVVDNVSRARSRLRQGHTNAQYRMAAAEHQHVPTLRTWAGVTICGMP